MRQYTLCLNDYTLPLSVGIYEEEKKQLQPVTCHIRLLVQCPKIIKAIADVYNYEHLMTIAKTIGQKKHYDLLEQLSDTMAENYFTNPKVSGIKITLTKPNIINPPTTVSITMHYGEWS